MGVDRGKVAIINALCNGMSLRSTARVFNTHRTAIQDLLVRVGEHCERLMAEHMRNVDAQYLEADEIWTFCGKKERRLKGDEKFNFNLGDQFLFFAIDHKTKLIPAWALGKRTSATALQFLNRLKGTLNGRRFQISTDEWIGYENAIERVFGADVDYGTIHKTYEAPNPGHGRYAPPRVSGTNKQIVSGHPEYFMVGTSIVERNNLTIRTFPAPLHKVGAWLLAEDGESASGRCPSDGLLQLRVDSPDAPGHARDGRRDRVEPVGSGGPTRRL